MGSWMQTVAQSWLIYKLTGNNPLYLGWLGLTFAIPMIVIPPFGGVIVDRVDRIRLLFVTQTCALLLAAALALFTWAGWMQPVHLLIASFLGALLLAFDNPARQSLIPDLVPRSDLPNAISLNSATYTGAALVGPALAGILLGQIGAGWLFLLNAISYLAVIGALLAMRGLTLRPPPTASFADALLGGFRYARSDRLILFLLLLSGIAAIFGRSYQQILPIFADDIWQVGASGFGALLSAGGAGALLGAFAIASVQLKGFHGRVLIGSGLIFSIALVAFALVPWFTVALALLLIVGVASTVFSTMVATMLQLRVPSELRGRLMSLYAVTLIGMPALGGLGIAAVANGLGEPVQSPAAHWAVGLRDLVGVGQLSTPFGAFAGAPRAIVLGGVGLVLALLALSPLLLRAEAI
jgi:MFS family permease